MPETSALSSLGTTPSKQSLLRELNANHHDIVAAVNQMQTSLTHLTRLVADNYQRNRKAIISGHGEDRDEP
jgi:hypothetical protein